MRVNVTKGPNAGRTLDMGSMQARAAIAAGWAVPEAPSAPPVPPPVDAVEPLAVELEPAAHELPEDEAIR